MSKPDRPAMLMAGMATIFGRPGIDWTLVLRRQPSRMIAGRVEGGYTSLFEIICCECGDDPGLDYREIPLQLQRIRGPYQLVTGIAAYEDHRARHPRRGVDEDHFAGKTSRLAGS